MHLSPCAQHAAFCLNGFLVTPTQVQEKSFSRPYIPLVEMLCSNIIAIQHQDIKDVDGTDFSLGFPLRSAIQRFIIQTVEISALIYSLFFDRTSLLARRHLSRY